MSLYEESLNTIEDAMKLDFPDAKIEQEDIYTMNSMGSINNIPFMFIEAKDKLGTLTDKDKKSSIGKAYMDFKKESKEK